MIFNIITIITVIACAYLIIRSNNEWEKSIKILTESDKEVIKIFTELKEEPIEVNLTSDNICTTGTIGSPTILQIKPKKTTVIRTLEYNEVGWIIKETTESIED